MRLTEFDKELAAHDWYYGMSDDPSVWRKGQTNQDKLLAIAKESVIHQFLYDTHLHHTFSGERYGTERTAKPRLAFWAHQHSTATFVTTDEEEYQIYVDDDEVDEVDEYTYLMMEKNNEN